MNKNFLCVACLVFQVLWLGCGNETATDSFDETVDVGPGLDIEITEDQKAAPKEPELVGILPADFPTDLPLYLPSSLVDFGSGDGERYISLLSPHRSARVRQALPALLRGGGWQLSGDLAGSATLRKGKRQLRLRVEDGNPGTLMRFSY